MGSPLARPVRRHQDLPRGRHPDEGGPREHGSLPGGSRSPSRSRGDGVRGLATSRAEAARWVGQVRSEEGGAGSPSPGDPDAHQDGILGSARPLASRGAASAIPGARVRPGRVRRRAVRSRADSHVVGPPSERSFGLFPGALVAAHARELGPPLPPGMRVLVFTSLFPNHIRPQHGVFIKERMTRVAALPGMELRVVAPVPYYPSVLPGSRRQYARVPREEVIEGLPVSHPRYFMIPKVATGWHGPMMARGLQPFLERIRASFDFDVIDAHYLYPDGYAAVAMGRALGKPVVVSARGSDINVFREIPSVRGHLERTLAGASALIAVSDSLANAMRDLGAESGRITVIPNGVDTRKFRPVPRDEARARTGLPPGRVILGVGHLIESKGFDRLLQAFRALLNRGGHDDLRLVIVGEGVYRSELERMVGFLSLTGRVLLP